MNGLQRKSEQEIHASIGTIMKMVMLGAVFAAVGYLLILAALFLELTQFHPLLEEFFDTYTQHSLAGGGPDRAGMSGLNTVLYSIHKSPSTLLWMKLGSIGHILVGIFIVLAGIIRALSLMPHRLSYELEKVIDQTDPWVRVKGFDLASTPPPVLSFRSARFIRNVQSS